MPERPVRTILERRHSTGRVIEAGPKVTVHEAARRMAERACGSILVTEDSRLLGIFTEHDLLNRVVVPGLDPATTSLADVMTSDPETIGADEPVGDAIRRMDEGSFRHLPVLDRGRVLGIISVRDIPALDMGRMASELDERHRLAERMW
jgi:CBS domain-containing protein